MKKGRFTRPFQTKEEMTLQITPMADVFTILLVFLLKSFSVGISSISPSQSMTLPSAKAADQMVEALKIEISNDQILLDNKHVSSLENFKLAAEDVEADGTIRSLNNILLAENKKILPTTEDGKPSGPSPILVMADEKTPYNTVHTVLSTLAKRGHPDFKLVVVEEN